MLGRGLVALSEHFCAQGWRRVMGRSEVRAMSTVVQGTYQAPHTQITDPEHAMKYPEYYKERVQYTLEDYTPMPTYQSHLTLPNTHPDTRTGIYISLAASKALYYGFSRVYVNALIASMSASAETLALGTVEVDISSFEPGTTTTVKWRGKPVFFKHRTPQEIELARREDNAEMRDPQPDADRVIRDNMLVVVGICTHLGCVPIPNAGEHEGGFFCPCHGSHYDVSGRIRKGPAPLNLEVPTYRFTDESTILVG
uniref:Cytochrome b-c1 complex subunit Rieske, mitochondrial n=1 Tax=Lygus hesperus TaxID=30085 RepID=A0A0A9WB39_LYGHE